MKTCLYHSTDCTDPYRNLALEEMLFNTIQPGEVLLYLWQNENTVVIGRNQNAWRECRLESFSAQNGRLARRLSGGGAVFHDLGNQNFTFIAPCGLYDVERQTEVIRLAAGSFGIEVKRSGRNDILADGRKFSGNAFHQNTTTAFHHGTILISSNLGCLAEFLAPPPEKLAAKGVKSVRARVINLCEINPNITPAKMRDALIEAFGVAYGLAPKPLPLLRIDAGELDKRSAHYASDTWRLGRFSGFSYTIDRRFSFGGLAFHLSVDNGQVIDAKVYSDAMDASWVQEIERNLQGLAFASPAIADAIPDSLQNPSDAEELRVFFRQIVL